ncbi:hydroquinone glucosyltransferase [Dorcoceras hygrometricum]|uniref:Hydroquinone glucosyltransferase n=1 Tax=Dorcoceras hygrometricum TaxID=472368 RepID=A0A2Z7AK84_9LAMI|nr:hydroquinone glucosyltransferase [Dorcoceras hygrometricum]
MENSALHIAVVPTPGMGHLIPLVEFAKKLLHRHNFSATFFLPNNGPLSHAQRSFLFTLPPAIEYVILPSITFDDDPGNVKPETRIGLTITRSVPLIRDAVGSLNGTKKFNAFVVDMFAVDAFDEEVLVCYGYEFKIPPYLFFPSSAMTLSVFFHLPKLDKTVSGEYRDLPEKFKIPGCIPLHGSDFFEPAQDRKNDAYRWILHLSEKFRTAPAGIIVNSFKELEPGAFEALQKKEKGKPDIYAIGPLIQMGSNSEVQNSSVCLNWLDEQPISSVLFVSFGSGGTLSHAQITELALGLEMSEQRFLWVIRCPSDRSPSGPDDPLSYLPEKFVDRTKDRGLVVPVWAPQAQILAHGSTCAFLSHCGWNSTLESVVSGVALIAWPLVAEQKMNAVLLHEDVKVALRPKVGENGLVGRVEVCWVVQALMEGEEGKGIRSRMRALREGAARALTSSPGLDDLAKKWIN